MESFLIESLAYGLLHACRVEQPPVPVREIIRKSLPIFGRLSLLELRLGLYESAYRSTLDGGRLIVVDADLSPSVQRAAIARGLYVAFCCSPRAIELNWPDREDPYRSSALFARRLLMPAAWVQQFCAGGVTPQELAGYFGVPAKMATQRIRGLGRQEG